MKLVRLAPSGCPKGTFRAVGGLSSTVSQATTSLWSWYLCSAVRLSSSCGDMQQLGGYAGAWSFPPTAAAPRGGRRRLIFRVIYSRALSLLTFSTAFIFCGICKSLREKNLWETAATNSGSGWDKIRVEQFVPETGSPERREDAQGLSGRPPWLKLYPGRLL